jgi:hypothetical protein
MRRFAHARQLPRPDGALNAYGRRIDHGHSSGSDYHHNHNSDNDDNHAACGDDDDRCTRRDDNDDNNDERASANDNLSAGSDDDFEHAGQGTQEKGQGPGDHAPTYDQGHDHDYGDDAC